MKAHFAKPILRATLLACLLGPLAAWAGATDHYWHDTASRSLPAEAPQPAQFRSLSLDSQQMMLYLKSAHADGQAARVSIPLPEGGFTDFDVVDSGTMSSELQARMAAMGYDILSLKGRDADGRRIRLDVSPIGFQAMVFDPDGVWVIRPEAFDPGNNQYLSFRRNQLQLPADFSYIEDAIEDHLDHEHTPSRPDAPNTESGAIMRTYRAAVAANNRYITAVGGGTAAGGQAAVVVAMNRVNELYNFDLSVQLELIPDNIDLMFPNASSDPFSANSSGILSSITGVINGIVGSANYDIGHAFTTGSGGVAYLRAVCGGNKGGGTTGLPNPIGDAFYIDFVSHEMGHQFGGNHPFNGSLGNCSGGNRNGSTAYEPGSGNTIQSYAGICGADDLQPHSDPYFHAISLQEINNFINNNGTGGSCGDKVNNPNQMPVIDPASMPPAGKTIPARTPFLLSASASDPDGDTPLYTWEEWDLGPQAPLTAGDNGSSPIFRSWPPTPVATRSFPSMSTVLGGPAIKGETMPTTSRELKFRLTVRDRDDGLHGMGRNQSADYSVQVSNSAGPFKVTGPSAGTTWYGGGPGTVTWDVANTNVAPVNCANVDVLVSVDNGNTFDLVAASSVPNTGSATVTVPPVTAIHTNTARVAVICSDNVFFNVSPANFTIMPGGDMYEVSGTVSGLNGSGLVLRLNGGSDLPITTDGPFNFDTPLLDEMAYQVTVASQPVSPFQECTVTNGSGTIDEADVTDVEVTCVDLLTYNVGGTISGLTNNGLKLSLNNGEQTLSVPANATDFIFPYGLLDHSTYSVLILTQPGGQTCSINQNSGTLNGADVNNISLACTDNPITPFMVGGRVSGLTSPGLVLQLNGGLTLTVNNNGLYNFYPGVNSGDDYEIAVLTQPAGQICTVANATGTVGYENVSNVDVACEAEPELPVQIFADEFEGDPVTLPDTCSPLQLFEDASFEATDDSTWENPYWDADDDLGGTPFCDESCDDDAELVARTGTWFVWFGGWAEENYATLSQSVVFPAGQSRWLNYWGINYIGGDPNASLTLKIDGTAVTTITPDIDDGFWSLHSIEIPAQYLDGNSHEVLFDWATPAQNFENAGFLFDDVTLDCEAARPAGTAPRSGNAAGKIPLRRTARH